MKRIGLIAVFLSLAPCIAHAQWVYLSNPYQHGPAVYDTLGDRLYIGGLDDYMYFGLGWTSNAGISWNWSFPRNFISLATIGNVLVAGTATDGIFFSSDSDSTWLQADDSIFHPKPAFITMIASNSFLFAGTNGAGIYRSADSGKQWELVDTDVSAYCFTGSDSVVLAGGVAEVVYRTTDEGKTWNAVQMTPDFQDSVYSLTVQGTLVFAATTNGLYRSSDVGLTWNRLDTTIFWYHHSPYSLLSINGSIIVGMEGQILRSSDGGKLWQHFDNGWPTDKDASHLIASGNYLFAGSGYFSGLWRRPLSDFNGGDYVSPLPPVAVRSGPLEIYDVLGRLIYHGSASSKPQLAPGFYFERSGGNVRKVWVPE